MTTDANIKEMIHSAQMKRNRPGGVPLYQVTERLQASGRSDATIRRLLNHAEEQGVIIRVGHGSGRNIWIREEWDAREAQQADYARRHRELTEWLTALGYTPIRNAIFGNEVIILPLDAAERLAALAQGAA